MPNHHNKNVSFSARKSSFLSFLLCWLPGSFQFWCRTDTKVYSTYILPTSLMFLFPFVHQSIRNEWGHHIEYNISIWWSKTFHPILFSRSSLHISFSLVKLAYRPQIISFTGSPAEKADLEVADEILEVNGESLENSNHTDVIAHIHNVSQNTFNLCIEYKRIEYLMFTVHKIPNDMLEGEEANEQ